MIAFDVADDEATSYTTMLELEELVVVAVIRATASASSAREACICLPGLVTDAEAAPRYWCSRRNVALLAEASKDRADTTLLVESAAALQQQDRQRSGVCSPQQAD